MKNTLIPLCLALVYLTIGCAFGQLLPTYKWAATVKVVGEDGAPVAGADVAVSYNILPAPSDPNQKSYGEIKGLTDTNGMFSASHTDSSWSLGINIEKAGYYTTHIGHELYQPGQLDDKTVAASRNPTIAVTLKKIGKPIPMYAKRINSEPVIFKKTGRPPIAFTNSVGYDLMAGDWVAPCGKGQATDLVVTEAFDKKSVSDYDYKLTISFPNAGDGIQEFAVPETEKGSGLRSPHEAPADGYQSQLVRENFHHPGQAGKSDYDENRNYFFRVRTVLDSNGNVKSALYGKIYGDPDQMNFRYYLNPTPNSRNMEFDSRQNLFKNLPSLDQVSAP
ncbi:MAG TPA: hypothetical protein VMB80_11425 [Candidatus Acidoferrum sp.]|nr:hypothetical protein [Candidatus Acidoferrum sp.]